MPHLCMQMIEQISRPEDPTAGNQVVLGGNLNSNHQDLEMTLLHVLLPCLKDAWGVCGGDEAGQSLKVSYDTWLQFWAITVVLFKECLFRKQEAETILESTPCHGLLWSKIWRNHSIYFKLKVAQVFLNCKHAVLASNWQNHLVSKLLSEYLNRILTSTSFRKYLPSPGQDRGKWGIVKTSWRFDWWACPELVLCPRAESMRFIIVASNLASTWIER